MTNRTAYEDDEVNNSDEYDDEGDKVVECNENDQSDAPTDYNEGD